MGASSNIATNTEKFECLITRIFDAPRERVFEAWAKAEHRAKWFGPKDFTATVIEDDVRTGGAYHFHMRGPNYDDHWRGVYREVVVPERLVFTWGGDTVVTVTLEDLGGKTRLTLRHEGFPSASIRDEHTHGWSSTLERLGELMETAS